MDLRDKLYRPPGGGRRREDHSTSYSAGGGSSYKDARANAANHVDEHGEEPAGYGD